MSGLASQQLRGLAGFTKAGGSKGAPKKKSVGSADDDNPLVKPVLPLLAQPKRKAAPYQAGDLAIEAAYKQAHLEEHHAWIKDMTTKFKLQQAALKVLPERLRQLAMAPDHTPFPMDRNFMFDTAPEAYRDGAVAAVADDRAKAQAGKGAGGGRK